MSQKAKPSPKKGNGGQRSTANAKATSAAAVVSSTSTCTASRKNKRIEKITSVADDNNTDDDDHDVRVGDLLFDTTTTPSSLLSSSQVDLIIKKVTGNHVLPEVFADALIRIVSFLLLDTEPRETTSSSSSSSSSSPTGSPSSFSMAARLGHYEGLLSHLASRQLGSVVRHLLSDEQNLLIQFFVMARLNSSSSSNAVGGGAGDEKEGPVSNSNPSTNGGRRRSVSSCQRKDETEKEGLVQEGQEGVGADVIKRLVGLGSYYSRETILIVLGLIGMYEENQSPQCLPVGSGGGGGGGKGNINNASVATTASIAGSSKISSQAMGALSQWIGGNSCARRRGKRQYAVLDEIEGLVAMALKHGGM